MKIHVLPRYAVRNLIGTHGMAKVLDQFNVISINDLDDPFLFSTVTGSPVQHTSLLSLKFSDIEGPTNSPHTQLFTRNQAKQIVNFLTSLNPKKDLIIHCAMGIARSGAVAKFAQEFFQIPYQEFISTGRNNCIQPNTFVYLKLREVHKQE